MKKIIILSAFFGVFVGVISTTYAAYFNDSPMVRCDKQITHTLQSGDENNDVYLLQSMLVQGGYLHVNPNGYFGPSTLSAVKSFQRDNAISQTGVVGESTRNAVNERLCDSDVTATMSTYGSYGYNSGITYVDAYDPYASVITPGPNAMTAVYSTPQVDVSYSSDPLYTSTGYNNSTQISGAAIPAQNYSLNNNIQLITPATTQVQSTGIIYSSNLGYMYGIVPVPGTITIVSPLANSFYNEGGTVNLVWTTNNLNATGFQIFLENTSTGQSKQVGYTSGNNASFVLTRELLDSVCVGACDNNQQGSFRFVIATPVTDIAGTTSNFRAMVSPVTIRRPYTVLSAINLTASKTPVNSNEGFRMYVNTPGVNLNIWNNTPFVNAVIKLHALCVSSNVTVSIANVSCGQDFIIPISTIISEQGVPVVITNNTWFTQDVVFEVNIISPTGQVMGTSQVKVTVNPASFNW